MTSTTPALHTENCPFCDSGDVATVEFERITAVGRRKFNITGLLGSECRNCGESYASAYQHDHNVNLIDTFGREKQSFVTPGLIKRLREKFCLTQKSASKLFGAGSASVGKWEAGQLPSSPAALLLQCAIHVPGVVQFLGRLANVDIVETTDDLQWRSVQYPAPDAQRRLASLRLIRNESLNNHSFPESDYNIDTLYGMAA